MYLKKLKRFASLCILTAIFLSGCFDTTVKPVLPDKDALTEAGFTVTKLSNDGYRVDLAIEVLDINSATPAVLVGAAVKSLDTMKGYTEISVTGITDNSPFIFINFKVEDLTSFYNGTIGLNDLLDTTEVKIIETYADVLRRHVLDFDVIVKSVKVDVDAVHLSLGYTGVDRNAITRDSVAIALAGVLYCPWVDFVTIEYRRNSENYLLFEFPSHILEKMADGSLNSDEFNNSITFDHKGNYFVRLEAATASFVEAGIATNDGTGDNVTKKKGGTYASIPLSDINEYEAFEVQQVSGSVEYIVLHARFPNGVWEELYTGSAGVFASSDLEELGEAGVTHIIVTVNGEHERYEPKAAQVRILLFNE